ncbi:MAG: hypothetical protein CVV64_10705 [Candidatus Wallbacteria bacterium HGW-Wallbacteria-1]|jgi:hypothetical protein|uniref:Carboxypeptidase regulatory-like domain-containing protein n=1 Tax=Candidatus Wallbacteria bacterium HGW-Wallbacteria-1 TaxID=2013854 RepID=A0A2N1PPD2_9BACT|nr:MAG: hypothetical protein CVV64_10705 [Candidatus Wallbacteria bacterium HGW-Wallbacteria-1]
MNIFTGYRPVVRHFMFFMLIVGTSFMISGCGGGSTFTPLEDDINKIITPPIPPLPPVPPVTKTVAVQVASDSGTLLHDVRVIVLEEGISKILKTFKVWSDTASEKDFRAAVDDVGINDQGKAIFQLYPGKYEVWVQRPLYTSFRLASLEVGGDLSQELVVPVALSAASSDDLEFTGSLEGRVLASGGTPLGGALVLIEGVGGSFQTVTDSTGRYKFFDVPIGSFTFAATLSGYGTYGATGITVDTAVTNTIPDVTLPSAVTFSISGSLRDDAGAPIKGVDLFLVAMDTRLPVLGTAILTAADGSFTFTGVVPGEYAFFPGIRNTIGAYTREPMPRIQVVDRDLTLAPMVFTRGAH